MKEKVSDFLFIWIFILQPIVEGGICWQTTSKTGNCKSVLMLNVTKDQCCSGNKQPDVGWTSHENPSSGMLFFWEYLSKGAPVCNRCHNSCYDVICKNNMTCRLKNGQPKCLCKPKCTRSERNRGPICGTDMMKYKNVCHLHRYNCQYKTDIKVDYYGKCRDSCHKVRCPSNRFCVEDQNGLPHCINCSTQCSKSNTQPVCGNNFQTYQSACHLKAELCKYGIQIQIAYPGPCKINATCPVIQCPHFMECLVNPHTKQPACTNCRRQCSPLSVVPVCGSDNVSYKNYCAMRRKSCKMKVLIETRHSGSCNRKQRKCRGCRKHLKRRLRRRRQKHRKLHLRLISAKHYSQLKSMTYGGYSLNSLNNMKIQKKKTGRHKEFG